MSYDRRGSDRKYNLSEKGLERHRRYNLKRYWRNVDAGTCSSCGKEPAWFSTKCSDCQLKTNEFYGFGATLAEKKEWRRSGTELSLIDWLRQTYPLPKLFLPQ
jgi:hypothetical protein